MVSIATAIKKTVVPDPGLWLASRMISHVKFISISTRDQDRAVKFWTERAGFRVLTDQPFNDKQRWIELRVGSSDTRIVLFVKLQPDHALDAALEKKIRDAIRTKASPRHVPARILAVDIPSGLDCDTGLPMEPTVKAQHTATMVAQKKGFANHTARDWLASRLIRQANGSVLDTLNYYYTDGSGSYDPTGHLRREVDSGNRTHAFDPQWELRGEVIRHRRCEIIS